MTSPEADARLTAWGAQNGATWLKTEPGTQYVPGLGNLPDARDVAALAATLLRALHVGAVYRAHDDALMALKTDQDGTHRVIARARLAEILRTVLVAVPAPPPADGDPLPRAVETMRTALASGGPGLATWLTEVLTTALDRRASEEPVDPATVSLVPTPAARRPRQTLAQRQHDHALTFLGSVPGGTHRTTAVWEQYTRAATRTGVRPLGRATFYRLADLHLGPRARRAHGEVYRVTTGAAGREPTEPLSTRARAILTDVLRRKRQTTQPDPTTERTPTDAH
ncbi:hypothetical protein Q6346_04855 [Isoptericola sp. b490]|uniref:hypothetical protein n=1 Tax=Actinotalea lenta TaxID=3064654 RepID=UPI00271421BC|nr:hypothetical protein [Isoptericola sp. b490]MDO8120642.1 hypothetical protein [Isoptericola sp. b490]